MSSLSDDVAGGSEFRLAVLEAWVSANAVRQ